ncbi:Bud-site selection protein [Mycena galericulata]|nr:Bud-site selection protein [Mycena galericulata]
MNEASTSTAVPRGTKRKRPEPPKEHHELKAVHQAAKKARTFETQRTVKKLKGVRKKDPAAADIKVLEAELEELKTTDPDAIAHTALRTRLLSNRHLAENSALRAAIARETPLTLDTSKGSKVPARLLSARALAVAVVQAVDAVRALVLPKADEVDVDQAAEDEEGNVEEDDEEQEGEEVEDEDDAAGWESGSVDGADGDGDEEDDGWESGSVHSEDSAPPAKKPTTKTAATVKSTSTTKTSTTTGKPVPKSALTNSQFLPSLAVGFVRGGSSDSELEDVDVDAGGERKNRRGQRARRAIWEKKYGRGANHKKKEAEEAAKGAQAQAAATKAKGSVHGRGKTRWTEGAQVADGGWGARKSSAPTTDAGKSHAAAPSGARGAASNAYTVKAKADAGLHPSWAAKKALKEKLGGGGIVPSQGTKIVFS